MGDESIEDHLRHPRSWCEDLLDELAETHNRMFTCDGRGTYRGWVNRERREFLEEVLGLSDVDYEVCIFCYTFAVEPDWETIDVCSGCAEERGY